MTELSILGTSTQPVVELSPFPFNKQIPNTAGGVASQITNGAHSYVVQGCIYWIQLYIPASSFQILFVANEILIS